MRRNKHINCPEMKRTENRDKFAARKKAATVTFKRNWKLKLGPDQAVTDKSFALLTFLLASWQFHLVRHFSRLNLDGHWELSLG